MIENDLFVPQPDLIKLSEGPPYVEIKGTKFLTYVDT